MTNCRGLCHQRKVSRGEHEGIHATGVASTKASRWAAMMACCIQDCKGGCWTAIMASCILDCEGGDD